MVVVAAPAPAPHHFPPVLFFRVHFSFLLFIQHWAGAKGFFNGQSKLRTTAGGHGRGERAEAVDMEKSDIRCELATACFRRLGIISAVLGKRWRTGGCGLHLFHIPAYFSLRLNSISQSSLNFLFNHFVLADIALVRFPTASDAALTCLADRQLALLLPPLPLWATGDRWN